MKSGFSPPEKVARAAGDWAPAAWRRAFAAYGALYFSLIVRTLWLAVNETSSTPLAPS